jgi:hypothetical protein
LEGKLVSSGNETDITEICANALTAFSLVLSSGTGTEREAAPIEESADELTDELPGDSTNDATNKPALSVLKQDEFSLVVKVRFLCPEACKLKILFCNGRDCSGAEFVDAIRWFRTVGH